MVNEHFLFAPSHTHQNDETFPNYTFFFPLEFQAFRVYVCMYVCVFEREGWVFGSDDVSFSKLYLGMSVKNIVEFFPPSPINAHDKKKHAGFGSVEIQAGKAPTIGYFQGSLC